MNDIPIDIRDRIAQALVGRERQVLELRLGIGISQPKTLTQIGEALGLSREKVRQLQASALSNPASPMINAILFVDEIKSPNSGSANKWRKRIRARVKSKYGSLEPSDQDSVRVWIGSTNIDPIMLIASWARVDGARTFFLNDDGEIVGDWATEDVQLIQWPSEAKVKPNPSTHQERMERIREAYPRAWQPWDSEEDEQLRAQFARLMNFDSICASHERAPGGINSRLRKLLLIPQDQSINMTRRLLNGKES